MVSTATQITEQPFSISAPESIIPRISSFSEKVKHKVMKPGIFTLPASPCIFIRITFAPLSFHLANFIRIMAFFSELRGHLVKKACLHHPLCVGKNKYLAMNGMTVYMHRTIFLCDIVTSSGRSAPSILVRGQGDNYRGL